LNFLFLEPDDLFYCYDLYFSLPEDLNSRRIIVCLYQGNRRFTNGENQVPKVINPLLLDLTLNGSVLDGSNRFKLYDYLDVTLLCYKDRPNLIRIINYQSHIDKKNLAFEIIAAETGTNLYTLHHNDSNQRIKNKIKSNVTPFQDISYNFEALLDTNPIEIQSKQVTLKKSKIFNFIYGYFF
jgi:hypothetical protein